MASFVLSGLEVFASNNQVADKLTELGFKGVVVTGGGAKRDAVGVWSKASMNVPLPEQVRSVTRLPEIKPLV